MVDLHSLETSYYGDLGVSDSLRSWGQDWSWFWCSMGCIPWSTFMGCVQEESLDGDDRAGTLWSWWRCIDGCLGGTHFGSSLSLLDLATLITFDDAWRMGLWVAHGLASWTACCGWDGYTSWTQTWHFGWDLDLIELMDVTDCRRND